MENCVNGSIHPYNRIKFTVILTISLLILFLGIGLFMRTYLIEEETLAPDEIFTMMCVYEDSPHDALNLARLMDPNMTPVYFCIQYVWSRLVGVSVFKIRVLSVIFGFLSLPLIYALGRRLGNKQSAFGATLLLAVHPLHVYYSMEIRNYALLALLGLASMHTFVLMLQGGARGWWCALFAVDSLLALTHLFASLLFVAQALFLLVYFRRRIARCIVWLIGHAVIAGFVLLWLLTVDWNAMRSANSYMQTPNLQSVLDMLYALGGGPYPRVHFISSFWIINLGALFAGVLLLSAGALFIWFILSRPNKKNIADTEDWDDRKSAVLVLLWLFIPAALLLLASFAYTPCFWVRYIIYSATAVPLVVSLFISKINPFALRLTAIVLLVMLLKYEISLDVFRWRPHRDYWIPICSFIESNIQPHDTILILPTYSGGYITGLEMLDRFKGQSVFNMAVWTNTERAKLLKSYEDGSGLWLVGLLESSPTQQQIEEFLDTFHPTKKDFKNVGLRVYRVPKKPQ